MINTIKRYNKYMLLAISALLAACSDLETAPEEVFDASKESGVLVLCEGNFNSGNSTLAYYNAVTKSVENGVFQRANDRRLGDTGQSITIHNGVAYVAVENSGVVWGIDVATFRVVGQLTSSQTEHMINPRYVQVISDEKAYITDLYSPYITIFNPKTFACSGSIHTKQPNVGMYASTEQMAKCGKYVFVTCWSYSNKVLVVDSETDEVVNEIELSSMQPKSIKADCNGKVWVITDGGYDTGTDSYGENAPHLYRIDAASQKVELDITLPTDEAAVQLAVNAEGNMLYFINNDIYRMSVNDETVPTTPFIEAPADTYGKKHKLYGISVEPKSGDIYVADAVDYAQSGVVYRYAKDGTLTDQFRVGINPNGFAFTSGKTEISEGGDPDEDGEDDGVQSLVNKVYEFMPAPGHLVNGYRITGDFIHDGATMQEACEAVLSNWQKTWSVSLGGQGGYVVAGFDHQVQNSNGDYDIAIKGNPYSYQSEPGIIWVSRDDNGNGLPDDTWYELAGSEYGTENETLGYAITYYKPTVPGQDIEWTDNQGGSGIIPHMEYWNSHAFYWQDWIPTETDSEGRECHTYYGSRLKDTHTYDEETNMSQMPPFDWGYADNNGSDYFRNPTFNSQQSLGYYKISNAVTSDGKPADLDHIDFVKVQTGQTGWTPNLGEISTEVYGIWDAHIKNKK